jgi:hypothetical protein
MEAAGIEPGDDFDATKNGLCTCENCRQCRAANALHEECFKSRFLATLDTDLQQMINSCELLNATALHAIAAQFGDRGLGIG